MTKGKIHHLLATLIKSLFLFKIWNYFSISLGDSDTVDLEKVIIEYASFFPISYLLQFFMGAVVLGKMNKIVSCVMKRTLYNLVYFYKHVPLQLLTNRLEDRNSWAMVLLREITCAKENKEAKGV